MTESAAESALTVIMPREGIQSIMTKSKFFLTLSTYPLSTLSLFMVLTRFISMAERSRLAGSRYTPSLLSSRPSLQLKASSLIALVIISDTVVSSESVLAKPRQVDRSACGSISMARTFFPSMARAALKLAAVVVLPTPPFWLQIAITLLILVLLSW